jgi:hypothetical protein
MRYTRFLFEELIEVAVSMFALLLSESDFLPLFGSFVAHFVIFLVTTVI